MEEITPINKTVQNFSGYNMLSSELNRISRLDTLLTRIEDKIFTEEFMLALLYSPDKIYKFYSLIQDNKLASQNFVIRLMELSSKNALINKLVNSLVLNDKKDMDIIDHDAGEQDTEKVQTFVRLLKGKAFNEIHHDNLYGQNDQEINDNERKQSLVESLEDIIELGDLK